jgi:outer membrane protein assembly factor BamD
MGRRGIFLSLILVTWCDAGRAAEPTQTWRYGGPGQWTQAQTQPAAGAPELTENPTLDRAEQLLAGRRQGAARKIVLDWLRRNRGAPDRDRALLLLAESYYQYGDRIRAFYHLDELLDTYPESRLYAAALERQYEIGDAFLRGYKLRLAGLRLLPAEDNGVEIMFRIQERSPGSPLAERALLRTADYYYASAQYDLASDAYSAYAKAYPRSPEIPRVSLRQGYASLAQFRGLNFDATPLIDARAQLEGVTTNFPDLGRQENVPEVIERIDATLASKLYRTADFYRRTNEPRSAVYLYRYLLTQYPDSREAGRARQQLERMPAWAMADPPPKPTASDVETQSVPARSPESLAPVTPRVTPEPFRTNIRP